MEITTRTRGDVTILDPQGAITLGDGEAALRQAVHAALDGGASRILVNLAGVPLMDSSGLGSLLAAYRLVTSRGGEIRVMHMPPRIQDVLQAAELLTYFDPHDDEDEAIAAFGSAGPDRRGR